MEKANEASVPLYMAFVDYKKAFDTVKHGVWSLQSLVTSVLGHFGPFLRTEVTKDRTG